MKPKYRNLKIDGVYFDLYEDADDPSVVTLAFQKPLEYNFTLGEYQSTEEKFRSVAEKFFGHTDTEKVEGHFFSLKAKILNHDHSTPQRPGRAGIWPRNNSGKQRKKSGVQLLHQEGGG